MSNNMNMEDGTQNSINAHMREDNVVEGPNG